VGSHYTVAISGGRFWLWRRAYSVAIMKRGKRNWPEAFGKRNFRGVPSPLRNGSQPDPFGFKKEEQDAADREFETEGVCVWLPVGRPVWIQKGRAGRGPSGSSRRMRHWSSLTRSTVGFQSQTRSTRIIYI